MNKIFLVVFFLLFTIQNCFSQKTLSDYTYVIVSEQFSFLNEKDEFQLNSLTKFLFNKHGFHAYFNNEVPSNVKRCNGLWANVEGSPGFIYTKIEIVLKDCNGNEIFRSIKGTSKGKELKKAYYESMRKAFKSIEILRVNQKEITDVEPEKNANKSITTENNEVSKIVVADTITKDITALDSSEIKEIKPETVSKEPTPIIDNEATKIDTGIIITDKVVTDNSEEEISESLKTTPNEYLPSNKYSSYSFNNSTFLLSKTSLGYSFYEEITNSEDDLLLLGKIERIANTIVFVDIESNKLEAYFDEPKNLIVLKDGKTIKYKLVN